MAINRFTSRFKTRTDLMDSITPNNVVQMNADVPHGEWKPASWLPVVWQNERSKDYFVMSSGKVVSFDASGRIVPSGLLRRCLDATQAADVAIDYDANDIAARVVDLTTGDFVASAHSVSVLDFVNAAVDNGWLRGAKATNLAEVKALAKEFISAPVGILSYDVYAWAGDNPGALHFTNYQKQHLIQFFTAGQFRMPHVAAASAVSDADGAMDLIAHADLAAMPRYAGLVMASAAVGLRFTRSVAGHTSRTPITVSMTGQTPRMRSEPELVRKAGDFFVDDEAGILILLSDDATAKPTFFDSVSYFTYEDAASALAVSTQEKFIHFVGECRPGDFVTFDALSNMVRRSTAIDLTGDDADDAVEVLAALELAKDFTIGRVVDIITEPRGLLERVRTEFSGDEFDATAKMPGSATAGFSDMITLSEQKVADQLVIVNVKL